MNFSYSVSDLLISLMKTDVNNAVMHISIFVIVKKYRKIFFV